MAWADAGAITAAATASLSHSPDQHLSCAAHLAPLPQPPFPLHCPHPPSSSPHSWLGPAPSPSLSSAWHLIQTADKCPPVAQVKPLIETCSLHCEVTIFHLISAKCCDNPYLLLLPGARLRSTRASHGLSRDSDKASCSSPNRSQGETHVDRSH